MACEIRNGVTEDSEYKEECADSYDCDRHVEDYLENDDNCATCLGSFCSVLLGFFFFILLPPPFILCRGARKHEKERKALPLLICSKIGATMML